MTPTCNIAKRLAGDVCVFEMEHSGYKASIMAAEKLKDNGKIHPLPIGNPIPVIPIHCLPGCPKNWVRESGSYVVPVTSDIGLWFDWTMNDEEMIAVVPSVKSMNPLTGQKLEGCQMEQYRDECPLHHVPFAHDRYCEKCDYKWAPQNYITGTPCWWDGVFQSDGTVRQFFFTEDMAKDVATCLIGKENTVPAFGFAFFRYAKEIIRRKEVSRGYAFNPITYDSWNNGNVVFNDDSGHFKYFGDQATFCSTQIDNDTKGIKTSSLSKQKKYFLSDDSVTRSLDFVNQVAEEPVAACYVADQINVLSEDEARAKRPELYKNIKRESVETVVKEVAVGAGAAIEQVLEIDMRSLKDYHPEPQAVMRIYFVFEPQLKEIIASGGIKKIEGVKEGFLKGVPVGA